MKTAISIPDHLFDTAESFAETLGISRSKLYRMALQHYLREYGVTAKLNQVYENTANDIDQNLLELQMDSTDPELNH